MKAFVDSTELAQILTRLTDEGWIFPLHYSAISNNGSMVLGRYWKAGEAAEIVASHCPSGQLVLPMSMMVVDEEGKAALIKWPTDAEPVVVH
jgi:hypothetical protein